MYFEIFIFLVRKKKYNLKKISIYEKTQFWLLYFSFLYDEEVSANTKWPIFRFMFALNYVHFDSFFHWYILFARLPSLIFNFFRNFNSQLEGSQKISIHKYQHLCVTSNKWKFSILLLLDPKQVQISE